MTNTDNCIQNPEKGIITSKGKKVTIRANLPIARKRTSSRILVKYSEGLADRLVSLITEGKSLTHILTFKDMPSVNTFYNWLDEYPDFKIKYYNARARKAHLLVEKAELQPLEALKEVRSMDVSDKRCNAIVQAHRLAVDTNLKVAGLYNKQEYGDSKDQTLPTAIGVQVVFGECAQPPWKEVQVETVNSLPLSDEKDVNKL
jgi:hypothetical protein